MCVGGGVLACAASLATAYTLGENAGVLLIIQHVSLIPALVVGTCESLVYVPGGLIVFWKRRSRLISWPASNMETLISSAAIN